MICKATIKSETYSEPCQTFKMKPFAKIANGCQPFGNFAKHTILNA